MKTAVPTSAADFFALPITPSPPWGEPQIMPIYSLDQPTGYRDENGSVWTLAEVDGQFMRQKRE
jgi:hypothetical protein